MHNGKTGRRRNALQRLLDQLKAGFKNTTEGQKELCKADLNRINAEIEVLKKRIA